MIDTTSPSFNTNLPSGIATSSPRSTPLISTSQRSWLSTSITDSPSRRNSGRILNFRSSTLPLAKRSILIADGKRRILEISPAAAISGLMIMEIPSCSLIKLISLLYTGFLTLAIVWQRPAFLAIRQHRRFISSEPVTAIRMSAVSIPASICVLMLAPFPKSLIASISSDRLCSRSEEVSTITTLWFSFTS